MAVSLFLKLPVGEKVHETLEHADLALYQILVVPDESDVLAVYTPFEIRIANLVAAAVVFKARAK